MTELTKTEELSVLLDKGYTDIDGYVVRSRGHGGLEITSLPDYNNKVNTMTFTKAELEDFSSLANFISNSLKADGAERQTRWAAEAILDTEDKVNKSCIVESPMKVNF